MRIILLIIAALFALPAVAAEWGSYENARFGYVVDVPPDFTWGEEAANGDGRVFKADDGTQTLRVYGGNIAEGDFESDAEGAMGFAADEGWALSYQRVTPSWASYSGKRNGMIFYARRIALCDGTQFASFELEYPVRDSGSVERAIDRLVASLKGTGGC